MLLRFFQVLWFIKPRRACQVAVNWAVTDDTTIHKSIEELISSIFEE